MEVCLIFLPDLYENDELILPLDYGQKAHFKPTKMKVHVLYEDDHLLIANKQANTVTHPNETSDTNTLANGIAYYLAKKGTYHYLQPIHRLDKDTTGAILFAKHPLAKALLDQSLAERKIKRTYYAIVHGHVQKKRGTINKKIGRDRHHPTRRRISQTGQDAITIYEHLSFHKDKNMSELLCQLQTGRTHQIRVHLSSIGHPLVGDVLYGGKPLFYRQALHAKLLTFTHPFTLEEIMIEAPFLDGIQLLL